MSDITDKITNQSVDEIAARSMKYTPSEADGGAAADHEDNDDLSRLAAIGIDLRNMRITLDAAGIERRNKILGRKKWGMLSLVAMLALTSGFPIWFLQTQENIESVMLWSVIGIVAGLILIAAGCYYFFTRQINQDLQSPFNILVQGYVLEGWQNNDRRDTVLNLNIGNHFVSMSIYTMKRHVDDVRDLDRMMPGTQLLVEMTPNARVIVRIIRL